MFLIENRIKHFNVKLYPIEDIACECGTLKTAYLIDFQLILGVL